MLRNDIIHNMPICQTILNLNDYKVVVVGAGFFGLTIADMCVKKLNVKVAVIEKRNHIGGNAWSYVDDETNIIVHKYGSHLFHTSNKRVWEYVNSFAKFNEYKHKVWTIHRDQLFSMPINLQTIAQLTGKFMSPEEARAWVELHTEDRSETEVNFETKAIKAIGYPLYDALIKGYTHKQWNVDPQLLPESIFSRLPIRFDLNNDYFNDVYQGLPENGYGELFERMIDHKNIDVFLNTNYFEHKGSIRNDHIVVYTGPIDEYFDYTKGKLGWRTLDFTYEKIASSDFQGSSVINYADKNIPWTRIHEYKHLHPERNVNPNMTLISHEFSREALEADEPYYPINTERDRETLSKYRDLIKSEVNVWFGGRLGSYKYLDMHMAIASALTAFDNEISTKFKSL
jgi:UDP-galactopyranose mutase